MFLIWWSHELVVNYPPQLQQTGFFICFVYFLSGDALDELLSKKDENLGPIEEQTKETDERYTNVT